MAKLYIVATPIGNLEDISLRALRILKEVDLIACEDTRKTKILLDKYGIKTPLSSYHQYTRMRKIDYIIFQLKSGKNLALVSEAGTPGVSDPGQKLVSEIVTQLPDLEIIPIPGPNAAISALSISGFPTDRFLYLGFLPKKKGRKKLLETLKNVEYTIIFYESPYRILRTLNDLLEHFGDREILVARELTKKFEAIYRGKISELTPKIKEKGEFVVIVKND